jgi:hypothetical protein
MSARSDLRAVDAEGMTEAHRNRYVRLTQAQRDEALERAALIAEATGCSWEEADTRALDEVAGRQLRPLARADGDRDREPASVPSSASGKKRGR